jgi:hypothetical protein
MPAETSQHVTKREFYLVTGAIYNMVGVVTALIAGSLMGETAMSVIHGMAVLLIGLMCLGLGLYFVIQAQKFKPERTAPASDAPSST